LVETIPLSTTITPAMFAGRQIEWIVTGFGLAVLVVGMLLAPRRRRGNGPSATGPSATGPRVTATRARGGRG
jgi:apolipoprotein N-acyltransferase